MANGPRWKCEFCRQYSVDERRICDHCLYSRVTYGPVDELWDADFEELKARLPFPGKGGYKLTPAEEAERIDKLSGFSANRLLATMLVRLEELAATVDERPIVDEDVDSGKVEAQEWEYHTMMVRADALDKDNSQYLQQRWPDWKHGKFVPQAMIPLLNGWGDKGWEVILMQPVGGVGENGDVYFRESGYSNAYFCVMKRPKSE